LVFWNLLSVYNQQKELISTQLFSAAECSLSLFCRSFTSRREFTPAQISPGPLSKCASQSLTAHRNALVCHHLGHKLAKLSVRRTATRSPSAHRRNHGLTPRLPDAQPQLQGCVHCHLENTAKIPTDSLGLSQKTFDHRLTAIPSRESQRRRGPVEMPQACVHGPDHAPSSK